MANSFGGSDTVIDPSWNGEEEQYDQRNITFGGALNQYGSFFGLDDFVHQGSRSKRSPPVGLNLIIPADSLRKMLNIAPYSNVTDRPKPDSLPQQAPDKLKALNFHFSQIIIGDWQWESRNEGDLIAKCYFAKKKLVWEILDSTTRNGAAERVKRKFEIQWSEVLSISATFHDNQPSKLDVELSHRPTFYLEANPQPKRHTQWNFTSDFTGGSASRLRRHKLLFAPGVLEKHYHKIVRSDPHLCQCSQVPFPSLRSPFFDYDDCNNASLYAPMNIPNHHHHHHDFRHYRVLPVSPQVTGYFPMNEGVNSVQNQFLVHGGSQLQFQGQESAANAFLGMQANPQLHDGIHDHITTTEVLLGRRVNTFVQDADGLHGVQMMNPFVQDGLLETQENSMVQDGLLETQESSLVQEASQGNAKRHKTEGEGNFQVSVIPETSVMPPRQEFVEGDLHDNAIQNAFANAIPGWDFGSTYNAEMAGFHGEDGFVGTLTGDIDQIMSSYGMNIDHGFLNFDPPDQFGDADNINNIELWPHIAFEDEKKQR